MKLTEPLDGAGKLTSFNPPYNGRVDETQEERGY
jgi:hypothetical protein